MNATTYAVDLAKAVMQVYWVDAQTGEIGQRALKRSQLAEFFARRVAGRIVMEACGSAHHWARTLGALGHEVRLIHPRHVRAYVRGNKNDMTDARAIWCAAHAPQMRWVPIKGVQQQAVLALHRARAHWVKVRTQVVNGLRGLLYEFGVVLPGGRQAGLGAIRAQRAQIDEKLPEVVRPLIDGQLQMLGQIEERTEAIEAELAQLERQLKSAQRVRAIPGIGLLGSTALAALLGEHARGYSTGREFAACLGLVPQHSGTGGKVVIGSLSKRGDPYVRTLLIHGARSVITHGKHEHTWIGKLLERRPFNVAVVALANKMARTAWALVAHGRDYEPGGLAKAG